MTSRTICSGREFPPLDWKGIQCHGDTVKTISIKQLHEKTGSWVRQAGRGHDAVGVTDRGSLVAVIVPPATASGGRRERQLLPEYEDLLKAPSEQSTVVNDLDALREER